ncbi:interleukin-8-like [Platichthys flesus]|uniref:interleukin-8-like n=1 Tax=Platichthys flesus TaxID=8260 RepID=UPI001A816552|nr:interleukin-8-like [Platichthys flesus]
MMSSRVIVVAVMVFLASLAISEGMSLRSRRSLGPEKHCQCIKTESKPIGRLIEKVEIIASNSHCGETEIIATLKTTREEVCLNPEAPWVKKVIKKIMSNRKR